MDYEELDEDESPPIDVLKLILKCYSWQYTPT